MSCPSSWDFPFSGLSFINTQERGNNLPAQQILKEQNKLVKLSTLFFFPPLEYCYLQEPEFSSEPPVCKYQQRRQPLREQLPGTEQLHWIVGFSQQGPLGPFGSPTKLHCLTHLSPNSKGNILIPVCPSYSYVSIYLEQKQAREYYTHSGRFRYSTAVFDKGGFLIFQNRNSLCVLCSISFFDANRCCL